MKKIYATLGFAVLLTAASAQQFQSVPKGAKVPHSINKVTPSTQASQTIYVDYDFMDEDYNVNSGNGTGTYTRYIWDMNMNYDLALADTNITYAVVDFNQFYDSYNGGAAVTSGSFNSYTIDSVFILGGHENNSGNPDTIIVKIVALNGTGYPQTTVLHADTVIATQFGTTNDWLTTAVIGVEVNHQITNSATRFGVQLEYFGARQDTFGLIAGFGDLGPGNCTTNPSLPNFAVPSQYAINSYRYDMRFSPTYGMLPSASGADTYYECNGQSGKQTGADSENFLQNWGIWTRITIDGVGVEEFGNTGIQLDQNVPNPANGNTTVRYNLKDAGAVTFEVYDVTGKQVMMMNQGTQPAGNHQVEFSTETLEAGVYFYTLTLDGKRVTRRMTVTH